MAKRKLGHGMRLAIDSKTIAESSPLGGGSSRRKENLAPSNALSSPANDPWRQDASAETLTRVGIRHRQASIRNAPATVGDHRLAARDFPANESLRIAMARRILHSWSLSQGYRRLALRSVE